MIGGRYQYRFSDKFQNRSYLDSNDGATGNAKVDFGSEPFKNNVIGADLAFRAEVPFLTKLVDLLPVISTKQKSTISFTGEVAHLILVNHGRLIEREHRTLMILKPPKVQLI